MRKKEDLSDVEHGMVVGAKRTALSISETTGITISRVYREWAETKNSHEHALLMSEVRGEWTG